MNYWGTMVGIVVSLVVSLSSARATLIEGTDVRFGVGSLTIDSVQQLAWLDLTYSTGYSFSQAQQATGPGGLFAGFRHATETEVAGLFQSAGLATPGSYPADNANIAALINLLGATVSQDGQAEVLGISASSISSGTRTVPKIDYVAGVEPGYIIALDGLHYGLDTAASSVGNWLVGPVPEPSTAGLLLLGGGAFLRRRTR